MPEKPVEENKETMHSSLKIEEVNSDSDNEILKPSFIQRPKPVYDLTEGSSLKFESKLISSPEPLVNLD